MVFFPCVSDGFVIFSVFQELREKCILFMETSGISIKTLWHILIKNQGKSGNFGGKSLSEP